MLVTQCHTSFDPLLRVISTPGGIISTPGQQPCGRSISQRRAEDTRTKPSRRKLKQRPPRFQSFSSFHLTRLLPPFGWVSITDRLDSLSKGYKSVCCPDSNFPSNFCRITNASATATQKWIRVAVLCSAVQLLLPGRLYLKG